MIRALSMVIVLAALVAAAVWLADRPGQVSMEWLGYRIDMSFSLMLAAVAVIAAAAAVVYRFWRFLRRSPATLKKSLHERKRRRGYLALTRGMVAVAAGDVQEAERQVRRADGLLNDPPLTMLLSAQSAQLSGDDKAAGKYFEAMLERPETEFLGLRGLLTQAMKSGDLEEAAKLSEKAYRLKPKSGWLARTLFDLQVRSGRWADAAATLNQSQRHKLMLPSESRRWLAVVEHQMSLDAGDRGDSRSALKRARAAHDHEPAFVPAAVRLAKLWTDAGKVRKAAQVIERSWALSPHPDLAAAYWRTRKSDEALNRVRAAERLIRDNGGHAESHIVLGACSLEAELWGQARTHLTAIPEEAATARVCRMMAELEEAENGNTEKAREWLVRASYADPDPAWVCEDCHSVTEDWSALCSHCGAFDRLNWRIPPHSMRLGADPASAAPPVALPAGDNGGVLEGPEAVDARRPPQ